jgi:hypothetical protein
MSDTPYLDLAVDRVVELRNVGVLQHPLGRRAFAALAIVANELINPSNGYAEEQRVIAKAMFRNHAEQVTLAEALCASILSEPIAPQIEAMSDAELLVFLRVFVRRYFGLPDTPEATP